MANVTIIGAGAFGTALAIYNHRQGHQVCVWAFEKDLPESVRAEGENKQYLADVKVPAGVAWTNDMGEACKGADLVMIVVPSAHVRMTARALKDHLPSDAPIVSTAKGVETETLALMSDVLRQELPHHRSDLCYMSGPSFAREVAMGRPADVALAGADNAKARQAQEILHSASFRVYTSVDIIGVELGGAL
ncbi:NAD(P)-binding domain-containing protein, partial [bacterium]|nr:NAD(P)-binding domain-containing protein [bacterium]